MLRAYTSFPERKRIGNPLRCVSVGGLRSLALCGFRWLTRSDFRGRPLAAAILCPNARRLRQPSPEVEQAVSHRRSPRLRVQGQVKRAASASAILGRPRRLGSRLPQNPRESTVKNALSPRAESISPSTSFDDQQLSTSTAFSSVCSGLMYSGVPIICEKPV